MRNNRLNWPLCSNANISATMDQCSMLANETIAIFFCISEKIYFEDFETKTDIWKGRCMEYLTLWNVTIDWVRLNNIYFFSVTENPRYIAKLLKKNICINIEKNVFLVLKTCSPFILKKAKEKGSSTFRFKFLLNIQNYSQKYLVKFLFRFAKKHFFLIHYLLSKFEYRNPGWHRGREV